MRINNNIMALNAHRQLGANNAAGARSMERLSSGLRINRAGDDAAGLAISEKMRGQVRGLQQASRNAQDSISLIQTAEGALNESHAILQRMRELAVQASNDTNTDSDRQELQNELEQLNAELDRIGNTTEFNTKKLLDGSAKGVREEVDGSVRVNNNSALTIDKENLEAIQTAAEGAELSGAYMVIRVNETDGSASDYKIIGPDGEESKENTVNVTGEAGSEVLTIGTGLFETAVEVVFDEEAALGHMEVGESITFVFNAKQEASDELDDSIMTQIGANAGQTAFIAIDDMRSEALGVSDVDISNKFGAQVAIETVNSAIETVSAQRSALGAMQNRLEHTISNLGTSAENLQAAESRIRDLDMAAEMMDFTKNNILQQAATAMLAQANMAPQSVLQLLG